MRLIAALVCGVVSAHAMSAQTAGPPVPAFVGCYRLTQGPWSRPLGNAEAAHALPPVIRLDSLVATGGGWRVAPDIAFARPNRFPGTPRWSAAGDSLHVLWSNGWLTTNLYLVTEGAALRGRVTAGTDERNLFVADPQAPVVARRIACGTAA